jgi:peptidyl-prolyl cis-trans isomerase B (cyclophilin B)
MAVRLFPRILAAGLLVAATSGCGGVSELVRGDDEEPDDRPWEEQAADIDGIVNYREQQPEILTNQHVTEPVAYEVLPPVGGDHYQQWQDCNGMVYAFPIQNEHAVHSLEHGAVWVTYRPDLPPDQVAELAARVGGTEKLFQSPFPDLDAPISLQAWGYQLKVDDAGDERIDAFIRALRVNASLEGPTAPCDGGVSITGGEDGTAAGAAGSCGWSEGPAGEGVVDAGVPPAGEPREGIRTIAFATALGDIAVELDLARAPCTAASLTHLAEQGFYDGSKCHRMFPGILQCGDPTARGAGYRESDGSGGPSYRFADENLPAGQSPAYPAGTMAMANSGPDTNGSQFFFVYQDLDLSPDYAVAGTITEGMAVLEAVDEAGHDGAFDPSPGGGHPNEDVVIESVAVSDPG